MNIKYIFGVLFIIGVLGSFTFSFQNSYSNELSCKYQQKIDECLQSDAPRSITDYVCIQSDDKEDVVYQIVLDEKFKEIDTRIDQYLEDLEANKNYYFGKEKQVSYVDGIDDIVRTFSKGGLFWKQFYAACGVDIIKDAISCSETESTAIINAKEFFENKDSDCMQLANIKLSIAQEVAFDVLNLNKHAVMQDELKLYQQQERTKYDELLNDMMINQGYMMKILQKTPSVTKNTY